MWAVCSCWCRSTCSTTPPSSSAAAKQRHLAHCHRFYYIIIFIIIIIGILFSLQFYPVFFFPHLKVSTDLAWWGMQGINVPTIIIIITNTCLLERVETLQMDFILFLSQNFTFILLIPSFQEGTWSGLIPYFHLYSEPSAEQEIQWKGRKVNNKWKLVHWEKKGSHALICLYENCLKTIKEVFKPVKFTVYTILNICIYLRIICVCIIICLIWCNLLIKWDRNWWRWYGGWMLQKVFDHVCVVTFAYETHLPFFFSPV